MLFLVTLAVCILPLTVLTLPQQPLQQQQQGITTPIPIINQTEEVGPDGSVNFSYQTGNGIYVQEGLFIKKNENVQVDPQNPENTTGRDIQVIQGTFSYTAPDGQQITIRYIADENGYQPQGDHLPTPPPIPEDIAKAVNALQNQLQQQPIQNPQK